MHFCRSPLEVVTVLLMEKSSCTLYSTLTVQSVKSQVKYAGVYSKILQHDFIDISSLLTEHICPQFTKWIVFLWLFYIDFLWRSLHSKPIAHTFIRHFFYHTPFLHSHPGERFGAKRLAQGHFGTWAGGAVGIKPSTFCLVDDPLYLQSHSLPQYTHDMSLQSNICGDYLKIHLRCK